MNCPERTIISCPCSAAVTQYYAVELSGTTVSVCNAVTDMIIGWAANATTGATSTYKEQVDVQIGPIVLAACAAEVITAGTKCGITTGGLLTATCAAGSTVAGIALDTSSGVAGSVVRLLVAGGGTGYAT